MPPKSAAAKARSATRKRRPASAASKKSSGAKRPAAKRRPASAASKKRTGYAAKASSASKCIVLARKVTQAKGPTYHMVCGVCPHAHGFTVETGDGRNGKVTRALHDKDKPGAGAARDFLAKKRKDGYSTIKGATSASACTSAAYKQYKTAAALAETKKAEAEAKKAKEAAAKKAAAAKKKAVAAKKAATKSAAFAPLSKAIKKRPAARRAKK